MAQTGVFAPGRAAIAAKTLRRDRWWVEPATTFTVLVAFIVYSTIRAFQNSNYYAADAHLLSPFYSPCLADSCPDDAGHLGTPIGDWWGLSPALIVLLAPLGFRLTCYYYRKAYYRSFWLSPPACAVAEPRARYSGETRFPLIGQNIHRYFFYLALVYPILLLYDAVESVYADGEWTMGIGTVVLTVNALLLGAYTLSCHSCRHIIGGRLNHFSRHPVRYRMWGWVSTLNGRHMQLAWVSLFGVALADLYVALVAGGVFNDPTFF